MQSPKRTKTGRFEWDKIQIRAPIPSLCLNEPLAPRLPFDVEAEDAGGDSIGVERQIETNSTWELQKGGNTS
jgi:hypothetical protein